METNEKNGENQVLYIGIDVHKRTGHVTGILGDGVEVFRVSMREDTGELLRYLKRSVVRIEVVYEAGYFGYWLHDELEEHCGRGTSHAPAVAQPAHQPDVICSRDLSIV